MLQLAQNTVNRRLAIAALALVPAVLAIAGCAAGPVSANPSNSTFSISPGTATLDTNCTGCNAASASGSPAEQFTATLNSGGAAAVTWSVSGGDLNSGPGTINSSGQYVPPSYLTADHVQVVVTARLTSNSSITATAVLTLSPGFLQPLTPENASLGANGTLTVTGYLAEAGGYAGISYALSSTSTGSTGGQGSLSTVNCTRSSATFTNCTVTYTAPQTITATGNTFIVATVGTSASVTSTEILLNTAGVVSNPASHEAQLPTPVSLGSSGGNNNDFDVSGNQIADCCSGTLGALIQDNTKRQYLLSNNHILARSDHASVGDMIVQPGLIDNSCTPNGEGAGTTPVGVLTTWLPFSSSATNADVAIAQVNSGAVNTSGSILELGALNGDGTLAAAPPGTSSTGGKGEAASLNLTVAKSGRTTGLTCGSVSAVNLDVTVEYYSDCAETKPYLSKTFTNQIAISGNQFSDSGDSGSLVVDASNAEPVGLYFTGGNDTSGVTQAVASPAPDVLNELAALQGGGTTYTYVGGADHSVSCVNYGSSTVSAALRRVLPLAETARTERALDQARQLVNPSAGILGVAMGKSTDRSGEGAVVVYVDEAINVSAPATVAGVRTVVVPTTARAVQLGLAPKSVFESDYVPALSAAALNQAVSTKQQNAHRLMRRNPAFFAVGVGQSLDNPSEAALVIYVDRKLIPAQLPATIDGLRTRYIIMDRMHVTRGYATPIQSQHHCIPHPAPGQADSNWLDAVNHALKHIDPLKLKLD